MIITSLLLTMCLIDLVGSRFRFDVLRQTRLAVLCCGQVSTRFVHDSRHGGLVLLIGTSSGTVFRGSPLVSGAILCDLLVAFLVTSRFFLSLVALVGWPCRTLQMSCRKFSPNRVRVLCSVPLDACISLCVVMKSRIFLTPLLMR